MSKKIVNISLNVSEIIYDIQNKTHITGESRDDGKNVIKVSTMQADDSYGTKNQILRSIVSAFSNLKVKMSKYIVGGDSEVSVNNRLLNYDGENTTLEVELSMPANFNDTASSAIATLMHTYMVNKSIAEWFNITNKDDAKEYMAMSLVDLNLITEALCQRMRPTRKHYNSRGSDFDAVDIPAISVNGNNYVEITCSTEGADVYYTTNGETPTRDSSRYTGGFTAVIDSVTGNAIIKAIAVKNGMYDSDVAIKTIS